VKSLKKGDKGEKVKQLQKFLQIVPDGDFGNLTTIAVRKWQELNNLTIDGIVGPKTWASMGIDTKLKPKYSRKQIEKAVRSLGHTYWTTDDDFDLNIIGVRNSTTAGRVTNHYDDYITVSYKEKGKWQYHCWEATTDPGVYWINHPLNKYGCAILTPGQYKKVYKIDKHNGKYNALCQRNGVVSVYRDNNKDDIYDYKVDTIQKGYYGINIHRSSAYKSSTYINKYSAGCQVFKDPDDFDDFMEICYSSESVWGGKFTYTLIESKDIV